MAPTEPRRAAVLGKPVDHSLSPVLHGAGYAALGLNWTFGKIECDAAALPELVNGLGEEWAGLAVTMPGKRAALSFATHATDRARAVGAANTLTPRADGAWQADCTDVAGVIGALTGAGGFTPTAGATAVVLGAGGTAAAALAALPELAITTVTLVVRDPARAADAIDTAERVGLQVELQRWDTANFGKLAGDAAVLISTVPAEASTPEADQLAGAGCVLDVVYHPWPTPLAEAVSRRGGHLATGLDMLLHQAFPQFEQITGHPAPRAAMRAALSAATGFPTG
jgi:shikimate-5-dehydrogenase